MYLTLWIDYLTIGSSPIYSLMSVTLQGLTTLRAYKASARFLQEFKECVDRHNQSWVVFTASIRWNAFHIDFLCWTLLVGVSFSLVILPKGCKHLNFHI